MHYLYLDMFIANALKKNYSFHSFIRTIKTAFKVYILERNNILKYQKYVDTIYIVMFVLG